VTKEAHLEDVGSGLAPVTEGWFVVNVRDAAWETSGLGGMCAFEGVDVLFAQLGINVRALTPDRAGSTTRSPTRRTSSSSPANACS
jgi:hypothetical protein